MTTLKIANAFGNIDVRKPIPQSYVHVPGKNLQPLCRKLGIKFAPALTGFRERGRRARFGYSAVMDGVVISARSADKLRVAIADREARSKPRTPEQREAERQRRQERDTRRFAEEIRDRFPRMPEGDVIACAAHATEIGSGRVGRSSTADDPVLGAVIAYARHRHTDYDALLDAGRSAGDGEFAREDARDEVREAVREVLAGWE